jgi:hypothetical protein
VRTATQRPTEVGEIVRVLVVAGIPYGVLVVGVGSRLAMLLLRFTSPDRVIGLRSDDGFEIGRFTLAGTYNLLMLGAGVGIIGAGAYLLVASRLLGPPWFRHLTVGLAAAAVVGSMLVHADGVDFTQLHPTWLAVAVFVMLPGLFGAFIGPTVEAVARPDSWTAHGRTRWLLPLAALACFPPTVVLAGVAWLMVAVLVTVGAYAPVDKVRSTQTFATLIRAAWLSVAIIGLFALIDDIGQLT